MTSSVWVPIDPDEPAIETRIGDTWATRPRSFLTRARGQAVQGSRTIVR